VIIYPPVYFLVSVPFLVFGGPSYWGLRLVSIAAFVVCMVSSYRLFLRTSESQLSVCIGLLAFASFNPVFSWSLKGRVDMLSMAFSIVALDWFWSAYEKLEEDKEKKISGIKLLVLYLPAIVAGIWSIYTKQPSVVVPFSIFVFLLFKRKFDQAVLFALLSAGLCGLIFLFVNSWTQSGFLAHMRFLSQMPFSVDDLNKHLLWIGADWPKLALIPVILGVYLFGKKAGQEILLPCLLALLSGIITIYTLGTAYANVNHGLHFFWACCWILAICASAAPVLAGSYVVLSSFLNVYTILPWLSGLSASALKVSQAERVLKSVDLRGTTMLVEDPALAITAGAQPLFVDVATFIQIWQEKGKSMDDLRAELRNRKYSAVIINRHDSQLERPPYFWDESFVKDVTDNYRFAGRVVGNGEIQKMYVRKDDPQEVQPEAQMEENTQSSSPSEEERDK
ncbi:MAG: glycosyltransferase family 39 protein, partial [Candidatus Obscuribacterales bacterium]|nr:glycosyltransferase family 39 protein [Candidatus Obscuribacterales bacterium]